MKALKYICLATVCALITVSGIWIKQTFFESQKTKVDHLAPTLERIQNLSELVTNKVSISDILEAENKDYHGKWVINGDALITINLNQAQLFDIDHDAKSARLILPEPAVTSPRVDHTKTKVIFIKGKRLGILRNPKNKDVMQHDMLEVAQKTIEQAAGSKEIIQNAKQQARLILSNFYLQLGWELKVEWNGEKPETL